jgi:hypothetical protein
MTFEFQSYEHRKHFPMIFAWWKKHRRGRLDIESLGSRGLVVYKNGVPLAAAWLFRTDSKVANIGWTVTNPDASMRLKHDAVAALIEDLKLTAKAEGFTRVVSFSSSRGLTKILVRAGMGQLVPHDLTVGAI